MLMYQHIERLALNVQQGNAAMIDLLYALA